MATGRTAGIETWPCSTRTVTIRYTANGTNDKAPPTEEPRDRETITRGSVVAAGRVTALLTHSGADRESPVKSWVRGSRHRAFPAAQLFR
jgi:hypothetical protein